MTGEALWLRLREARLVEGDMPASEPAPPWFVRLMLGIAGWLGAIFLLAFVGIGFAALMRSPTAGIAVGAAVCVAAVFLFRLRQKGDLVGQFAFAISLAGQGLMAVGFMNAFDRSTGVVALCIAVQQAVLFLLAPSFLHRVWTAASGGYAAAYALGNFGLGAYAPALLTAAFVAVWLREFDFMKQAETVRAGGYGLAAAAAIWVVHGSMPLLLNRMPVPGIHFWGGAIACGAVLLGSALALLRREGVSLDSAQGKAALIGASILALVALKAPGVAPATTILVLGYAHGNRPLAGFGVIAMIAYLSHYYYSLQATLLEKSALLAAAGIALLIARFAIQRAWPEKEAGDA
jgi:hypothetical protein